jgi:hypothetical protein
LNRYNPYLSTTRDSNDHLFATLEMDVAMASSTNTAVVSAAQRKRDEAKQNMANGNLEGELQSLEEAVRLLSSTDTPLSLELYEARGDLLGTLVVAGRTAEAARLCEHVVAFLCIALYHVPNHPLLGLQLFTLGDLYEAMREDATAQATFRWARDILTVSQGTTSEMVQWLNEKIR